MNRILDLLKSETIEVIGCTEPAAIAYAFAAIRKYCPEIKINSNNVKARLSANKDILRNADTAGVPRLKTRGIAAVAAMGIFSANPQFNVFSKITNEQIDTVNKMLQKKNWLEIIELNKKCFYLKSELFIGGNVYEAVIKDKHDNLISFKINDKIIFSKKTVKTYMLKGLEEISDIVKMHDTELEEFGKYILRTNGSLFDDLKTNDVSEAIARLIEQRMSGVYLSICTFTGSGNQGLFLSIPFYKLYKMYGDKVLPAFIFALLTQIYLTQKKGLLSKQCGVSEKASLALSAGILYYKNESISVIQKKMNYMGEMLHGLVCEGAKESCADKGYMCMHNILRRVNPHLNI
ncbi:L-serine ammonia-lyase, iron-sulfur-dependent, subunit alpha [Candidatus Dependentiae bacterium]|nr:L-serine ammonia-lyase, iron-sulfur-dependent, subunit alpha [Candidatus Dependentiae bacterium]